MWFWGVEQGLEGLPGLALVPTLDNVESLADCSGLGDPWVPEELMDLQIRVDCPDREAAFLCSPGLGPVLVQLGVKPVNACHTPAEVLPLQILALDVFLKLDDLRLDGAEVGDPPGEDFGVAQIPARGKPALAGLKPEAAVWLPADDDRVQQSAKRDALLEAAGVEAFVPAPTGLALARFVVDVDESNVK